MILLKEQSSKYIQWCVILLKAIELTVNKEGLET